MCKTVKPNGPEVTRKDERESVKRKQDKRLIKCMGEK